MVNIFFNFKVSGKLGADFKKIISTLVDGNIRTEVKQ